MGVAKPCSGQSSKECAALPPRLPGGLRELLWGREFSDNPLTTHCTWLLIRIIRDGARSDVMPLQEDDGRMTPSVALASVLLFCQSGGMDCVPA